MIRNYIKIAVRGLRRNKAFSFINIFGLAVGLAACLLIMLYIIDESSYDKHHKDGDRIFRVAYSNDKGDTWAASPAPLAWGVKNDLPEVEQVTRLLTFPDIETMLIKSGEGSERKQFFETNGYYIDSTFFEIFTYNFIYGDQRTALNDPNSIVISRQMADKFFGSSNPTGKALLIATPFGEFSYAVKGVFDASKNKSHIPANFFLSMRNNDMWNWVKNQTQWSTNNIFFTYVKLKPGVNARAFEQKITPLFNHYAAEDIKAAGITKNFFIQPVTDIYLRSSSPNEIAANGNMNYLYILGSIAAFILMIACINFMNLSTARSQKRAREVGVRKVIGAEKSSLIAQFLGESFVMCILALVMAVGLAILFLPVFNMITQKNLQAFDKPVLMVGIIVLTLLTGLFSGLYPAFYLSSFRPVAVLKGRIVNSFSATAIRKGLVVFQFTVSVCLIFGAVVIWQQLYFLKNQALGFNKEQKIVLPLQQSFLNAENYYTPLKNELLKMPGVKTVSSGSSYPGIQNMSDMLFFAEGKTAKDIVDVYLTAIGNEYLQALDMKLISGRSFSNEFKGDSSGIILNETAVRQLGYEPQAAIGRKIFFSFANFQGDMHIVGVVKDFNFESLHNGIKPHGFTSNMFGNKYGYVVASLASTNYSRLISDIEKVWAKLNPSVPFVYSFLDQDFQRNYEKDQRTSQLVVYFTIIAILIACLGLFGLSAFAAEQRTKEIGVRKVLGASVASVTSLLSRDFIRLILIAIVIASPLAWYAMNQWLQDFAYRVTISWWMFAVAGLLAVVVAVITISFQSIKAALANPVKSLRTE